MVRPEAGLCRVAASFTLHRKSLLYQDCSARLKERSNGSMLVQRSMVRPDEGLCRVAASFALHRKPGLSQHTMPLAVTRKHSIQAAQTVRKLRCVITGGPEGRTNRSSQYVRAHRRCCFWSSVLLAAESVESKKCELCVTIHRLRDDASYHAAGEKERTRQRQLPGVSCWPRQRPRQTAPSCGRSPHEAAGR